jgi:tripartite-type tricarboxylate transporter receptor subunit TctC
MRRLSSILLAIACLAFCADIATAQDKYPSKPVRIIVPYAPGGATDIVARILGEQLRQILGQSFVVDNKPGAFGIIAIEEMLRWRPDGYTLMIGNVSTNAITPVLFPKKFTANYEKEVVPVMRLVDIPAFVVATAKDFEPKTLADIVNYAKKNPGKLRYGTVGAGSYPHFDTELFAKRAGGLDMIAIHNKAGAAGVINDLITGDTQVTFLNVASSAAQIKAGTIRPVAVINHSRLPDYPDIQTMAELGYPGVGTIAWQAMFASAGTPDDVLETMHKALLQALEAQPVVDAFKKQNFNIVPNKTLDEAKAWLRSEMDNWKKIANEVKIEVTE